eukprot:TRINITY_DN6632_c0_g1_i1.p1 TRINITY_DN6632_c0_g1~~TRINITY_DN6632_c0_g1_i1.p1  ORF type:complete len:150 (+),score=35.44 TRINITY_DN6632_c0_g1_i1:66-515(+)
MCIRDRYQRRVHGTEFKQNTANTTASKNTSQAASPFGKQPIKEQETYPRSSFEPQSARQAPSYYNGRSSWNNNYYACDRHDPFTVGVTVFSASIGDPHPYEGYDEHRHHHHNYYHHHGGVIGTIEAGAQVAEGVKDLGSGIKGLMDVLF